MTKTLTRYKTIDYEFHNVNTTHISQKGVAPFFEKHRYAILVVDLATISDLDPNTNEPKFHTLLSACVHMCRTCTRNTPFGFPIFLVFQNIETFNTNLSTLPPCSERGTENEVLDATTTIPTSTLNYLYHLFPNFHPQELANLEIPPNNPNTQNRWSLSTRAVSTYILKLFKDIGGHHNVGVFPRLIYDPVPSSSPSPSLSVLPSTDTDNEPSTDTGTRTGNSVAALWNSLHDYILEDNMVVCCCFGTGPATRDEPIIETRLVF